MLDIAKIIKFLAVNIIGVFLTSMFLTMALRLGFFPQLPQEQNFHVFANLLSGGIWCWIVGGLISLGYFFTDSRKRARWFLAAPFLLPLIYNCGILIYLNFHPLS